MFEACGVPDDKFRTICSAVDKLDKVLDMFYNRLFHLLLSYALHIMGAAERAKWNCLRYVLKYLPAVIGHKSRL